MSDFSQLRVLRLLEESPSRTQREVAHELGISLGKANYVLKALLAKGLVKLKNFRDTPNKRGYIYIVTPDGIAAKAKLARQFLALKTTEYDSLRLEIERLRSETERQTQSEQTGSAQASGG